MGRAWRLRLTPAPLRWPTLSPAAPQRGLKKVKRFFAPLCDAVGGADGRKPRRGESWPAFKFARENGGSGKIMQQTGGGRGGYDSPRLRFAGRPSLRLAPQRGLRKERQLFRPSMRRSRRGADGRKPRRGESWPAFNFEPEKSGVVVK
jgi:hypothetical protein